MTLAFNNLLPCALDPISAKSVATLRSITSADFSCWIFACLEHEQTLERLAANGAIHPLGFLKLVLAVGPNGERVRMHLWPVTHQIEAATHAHDHYWSFSSLAIVGNVASTFFETATDSSEGAEFHEWRLQQFHKHPRRGAPYNFMGGGSVYLKERQTLRVHQGGVYSMPAGEIHLGRPDDYGPGATLVLQGPAESTVTRTFHRDSSPGSVPPRTRESTLTANRLRSILCEFRKAL